MASEAAMLVLVESIGNPGALVALPLAEALINEKLAVRVGAVGAEVAIEPTPRGLDMAAHFERGEYMTDEIRDRGDQHVLDLRIQAATRDAREQAAYRAFDLAFRKAMQGDGSKSERAQACEGAFIEIMATVVRDLGGEPAPTPLQPHVFVLETQDGPLRVSLHGTWVACRFTDAAGRDAARARVGASQYSGKLNFTPVDDKQGSCIVWVERVALDFRQHLVTAIGDVRAQR